MTAAASGAVRAYRGRFAPSPTGPLHFGSLVAALAGWLDARAHSGEWLLRIEDLDTPRNVAGAEARILRQLAACGLDWDGEPLRQSARLEHYRAALEALRAVGRAFGCRCTRREVADSTLRPDGSRRYPGTCRAGLPAGVPARAWRLRVEPERVCFDDRLQGRCCEDVAATVGDFVLRRADGVFAYQLAVVVDDAAQGITDVLRGADLIDSTPRQILLQRALGLATPRYLHVPAAVNAAGEKLSKQTRAPAIDERHADAALRAAMAFLGLPVAALPAGPAPAAMLAWALGHWSVERLPRGRSRPVPAGLG